MSSNGGRRKGLLGTLVDVTADLLKLGASGLELVSVGMEFVARLAGVLPARTSEKRVPDSGRAGDRPLESEREALHREHVGTFLVAFFFLCSMAGGIVFLVSFWGGKNSTAVLGTSLAAFLGGMGVTMVVWARWLMLKQEAVEPRHPVKSSPAEREDAAAAFCEGAHNIKRRRLLVWMSLGGAGVFGGMVLSLFRSLGVSPDVELYTRVWQGGQRLVTSDGKAVVLSSLKPGSMVTVFPEDKRGSERAQTVLIRVNEDQLQLPKDRATWAPGGYVAYSRVCTHAGCPVGEYEAEQSLLLCPCHQSTFDVLRAAVPTGGPAARALPQLPLYADADGSLRAGGGFTAPPGPSFWEIS